MFGLESLPLALLGLGFAAFLAATVLPLASEVALLALLVAWPEAVLAAWVVATTANTAGGMSTYALARFASSRLGQISPERLQPKARDLLVRYGSPASALGFVPLLGDAIMLVAGALRVNALGCALWQMAGRGARYGLVVAPYL